MREIKRPLTALDAVCYRHLMCMLDLIDGGTYFGHRTRKARKQHQCGDCSKPIMAGEQYALGSGVDDGRVWVAKQCARCRLAARWLVKHCRGFLWGGVWEDIEEHIKAFDDLHAEQQDDLVAMLEQSGEERMLDDLVCQLD